MPIKYFSMRERLQKFFLPHGKDECWLWHGGRDYKGYGTIDGSKVHIAVYREYVGKIPEGLQVLHQCDNKGCVNPNHLKLGTNKENHIEAWERGLMGNIHKLTHKDILEIEELWRKNPARWTGKRLTQRMIATKYGVNQSEISRILSGHRGYCLKKGNSGFEGEQQCLLEH